MVSRRFFYGLPVILLVTASCNGSGPEKESAGIDSMVSRSIPLADTPVAAPPIGHATEAGVIDSLRKIPFVAESHRYIDSFTHHKQGIAFLIDTVSDKEVNFRAGYNGDLRFETYYFFIVNPQTFGIKIMDPVSGDQLTIAEYQKAQQQ
ncbi:hypothetical protein LL912_06280 [Niabella sp. CC-SYL272]|uniref:hypothetical protein n=1 Tax=Niabella agricola TaxID=2891571 RepID=UPI001F1C0EF6|nr:hypothetical protein [Niabella agricola]MCF3108377.1 hypothetical protein [Niabella agricola]